MPNLHFILRAGGADTAALRHRQSLGLGLGPRRNPDVAQIPAYRQMAAEDV